MADYKSPYDEAVLLRNEALTQFIKQIKAYPVAGPGTGILLVPDDKFDHLQIQNAIEIYSVLEEGTPEEKALHPGCICINDKSKSDDSAKTYIQAGNLLAFYTSNEDIPSDKNLKSGWTNPYGSFVLITNENYKTPEYIKIKGFDDNGNLVIGKGRGDAVLKAGESGVIIANKVRGAVFNDYAEYRESFIKEPGRCVIETGFGDLELSTKRLQLGGNIISDTFGFSIGDTDKAQTPIAVCGRVLAYPLEDRYDFTPGAAVCSGPNGTISLMTREEIKEWPDAIIGYVSEIPEYQIWGSDNIQVNNRIWIKIK